MNRETAIQYLIRKGKIEYPTVIFSNEDEAEIAKVMKNGKIYGDPCVILE